MIMGLGNIFRASVLCSICAFLLAGFFAVRNISSWPARISYPGDESYEGVALAEMIHLHNGMRIYAGGAKDGFDAATYGPLFYFAGEHLIDSSNPSYFPLRLLSAFAILGCAVGCGLLAFWLTRSWMAVGLSPLVFLSYGMTTAHGIVALSDSVSLFLCFFGFLVAYRFRNSRAVLFAVPLMVLGFYYKPQYIAGPVAVLLFLLLEKRCRLAIEFAGLLAVCGLGLFALFQWVVFHGQAFWRHFLLYQTALLSWHLVGRALFWFVVLLLLPLALAAEYLRENRERLVGLYLLVAVVLGFVTFCKGGSGSHYFFESVLVLSAVVPAALEKQYAANVYRPDLVLLLGMMVFAGQWIPKGAPLRSDIARHNAMQSFLRTHFPSHAEALSLSPGDLLQAGLEAPFAGLFQLVRLSDEGIVSDGDVLAQVRDHRFAVIVLPFDTSREHNPYWLKLYTPAVVGAIDTDYKLEASLEMPTPIKGDYSDEDRFYIYVPRQLPAVSTASEPQRLGWATVADPILKYGYGGPEGSNR